VPAIFTPSDQAALTEGPEIKEVAVATIATQRSRRLNTRTIGLVLLTGAGIAASAALMVQTITFGDEPVGRAAASFAVQGANHSRALNVPASTAEAESSSFSLKGVLAARAVNEVEGSIDPFLSGVIDARALNEVGSGTTLNLDAIIDGRALNEAVHRRPGPAS
jgi:hypothetical protein